MGYMNYEERLEVAKRLYELSNDEQKTALECIFPELCESEDEKVREDIISLVNEFWERIGSINPEYSSRNRMLAWLEKQGEQKPNANCLLNWSETDEKMFQSLESIVKDYWAKAEQEKNEIKIREASNVSYFLKTIQKSPICWIKCSDGLPNRDGTYLVVTDGKHNDVYDMARYDSIDGWHKASEIIYWMPIPQLNNKSIIEQKSADWSEDDEKILKEIITDVKFEGYNNDMQANSYKKINWLKSIKDRIIPQPKQEWSKEDEKIRQNLMSLLSDMRGHRIEESTYQKYYPWLKSLKDRYTWKSSDAQMRALEYIINNASNTSYSCKIAKGLLEQLRKLKGE